MTAETITELDVAEIMEPGLWAMWIGFPLPPGIAERHPGCPMTGWVHEGSPPYRVIVSDDPFELLSLGGSAHRIPYVDSEPTVHIRRWLKS